VDQSVKQAWRTARLDGDQARRRRSTGGMVAAVRALFAHQVVLGARAENPVPAPRRGQGLRAKSRGVLGHLGPGRRRGGGRLVRQAQRLPEALEPGEVAAFLADLSTHRDRAITLAMLLGGPRAGEVRSLRLADIDQGLRRLRVCGKGGRERVVPVHRAFFAELAAYLRVEQPPGLATPECFVVLAGASAGGPLAEAGLRSIFRHHRRTSGAARVRPHRLRHTHGTELAAAGIDLMVLRELMGHASPETTAGYVHPAAEDPAARQTSSASVTSAGRPGPRRRLPSAGMTRSVSSTYSAMRRVSRSAITEDLQGQRCVDTPILDTLHLSGTELGTEQGRRVQQRRCTHGRLADLRAVHGW
jgi:integrase/recombinase XerC